ncbi:DNA integrity scanning protein DisA nucleotide-binding domain protein, partial [Nostoc ellipsosporum NOK]|nr:DNA integrity scanning protein DisA nucleotide-binding domain protein [Nostoc ellipsosporum NOK]
VRINYDPTQTPLANIVFVQIAKNLIKNNFSEKEVTINNFQLIKIIQRVWHRILKLAVDFGHGSQFVIIQNTATDKFAKNLSHYFNIDQLTTQKPNLGECIIKFFKRYLVYKSSEGNKDDIPKELLTEYHQLINSIDSIAYLSTIDGSIILDYSLSLIGFGGEIKNKEDLKDNCFELAADFGLDEPLFQESDSSSDLLNKEKSELVKLFIKSPLIENLKVWNFEEFGTRHRSAARLCTQQELDPFVFVVSQTGDIREFMNLEGKVRVLGPLRPL